MTYHTDFRKKPCTILCIKSPENSYKTRLLGLNKKSCKIIISRIVPLDEPAASKAREHSIDKALRLAAPDASAPCLTFQLDFGLQGRELSFEIGLL